MRRLLTILFLSFFFSGFSQENPEIHCKHFFGGYPAGTPKTNDLIIRDIYALSNNDETKFADWVAYRLDIPTISGSKKTRNWNVDPWLDESETLEPSPNDGDYKGAWANIHTDRGHQAPLASFDGTPEWFETNYMSNITPQKSDLNQGVWAELEGKVRDMVKLYKEIYVMTGPLYDGEEMPKMPGADESHIVPTGYWKIVIYQNESGWVNASAFIFEQDTPRSAKILDGLTTIDEIEKRSKLDFLWDLDESKEVAIEKNLAKEWAEQHFNEG